MNHSVVVFDDDPTGTQTVHDVDVLLRGDEDLLDNQLAGNQRGFFILTNSRGLPASDARELLEDICTRLASSARRWEARLTIISRSDSTLRGHFPLETDVLEEFLGPFNAVLHIPYFEAGGRYTNDDVHYVLEGEFLVPVGQTQFARDATFGFRSSNLREFLEEKSGGRIARTSVQSISLEDIRLGGPQRVLEKLLALPERSHCIVNACHPSDLQVLTAALIAAEFCQKRYLYRSAAGFVGTRFGVSSTLRPALESVDAPDSSPKGGLIIAGSHVPKTTTQIGHLISNSPEIHHLEWGIDKLLLPTSNPWFANAAEEISRLLSSGKHVLASTERHVYTGASGPESLELSRNVSRGICRIVSSIAERPRFVVAKGGITSSDIAVLGCNASLATVRGQIIPGVPLWILLSSDRWLHLPYVVFPGNVGGDSALTEVFNRMVEWSNTAGQYPDRIPWHAPPEDFDFEDQNSSPDPTTPPAILLGGFPAFPKMPRKLRAGPLTLMYLDGDIRNLTDGSSQVIRRIHAAIRDHNWGTVPGRIEDEKIEDRGDSFRIRFVSVHHEGEVHFAWEGRIEGRADGSIDFEFEGLARTTFRRNRIGLCVLHPLEWSGKECQLRYLDGSTQTARVPELVAADQPIAGFSNLSAMAWETTPGNRLEIAFEGDAFETEDQRNWIDASFKTFCTPLRLPFPVTVPAASKICQAIRIRWKPNASSGSRAALVKRGFASRPIRLSVDSAASVPFPQIGLCATQDFRAGAEDGELGGYTLDCLQQLKLNHLRCDVDLSRKGWVDPFERGSREARNLDLPIELAIHLPAQGGQPQLESLERLMQKAGTRLARILVFTSGSPSTLSGSLTLARKVLRRDSTPFGVGSNADFYQLNQHRPDFSDADFVAWSMNPQVHASDSRSVAETPSAVASQIHSAQAYFPGKAIVISPVTLKPRFNAVATGPVVNPGPGELPHDVDLRQLSLFCAGWTLGMVGELTLAGAASVSLFETAGWKGVVESVVARRHPKFPSEAGTWFPTFHLLHELAQARNAKWSRVRSEFPFLIRAFLRTHDQNQTLFVANLTSGFQVVETGISLENADGFIYDLSGPEDWEIADPAAGQDTKPKIWGKDSCLRLPPYAWAVVHLHGIRTS